MFLIFLLAFSGHVFAHDSANDGAMGTEYMSAVCVQDNKYVEVKDYGSQIQINGMWSDKFTTRETIAGVHFYSTADGRTERIIGESLNSTGAKEMIHAYTFNGKILHNCVAL